MSELLTAVHGILRGLGGVVGGLLGAGSNPYMPVHTTCPAGDLVRPAAGSVAAVEAAWVEQRTAKTTLSLQAWLNKTGVDFGPVARWPQLAIAYSGGGMRAQLCGAGVRQALDGRESTLPVAGLLQAMTYEAGLSGGAWMLGSVAGNNYPTVSYLLDKVWGPNDAFGLLLPSQFGFLAADLGIVDDVASKLAGGWPVTIVDVWARLLSWNYLEGPRGGAQRLWSDIAGYSNFAAHDNPLPIITALGTVDSFLSCQASTNSSQFEMTPFEFGSWDPAVAAFVQTKYLGTDLRAGKPRDGAQCVTRYDNTGYLTGTSSDIFAALICSFLDPLDAPLGNATGLVAGLLNLLHDVRSTTDILYAATFPNPFHQLPSVRSFYADPPLLNLVDGGTDGQNNPLWPFLHRPVDVVFVSDNGSEDDGLWPNGAALRRTYEAAQRAGMTAMPLVPPVAALNITAGSRTPRFFGCHDPAAMTIVYLPNKEWTYNSGTLQYRLRYSRAESAAMIANSNQVANFGGVRDDWDVCLGCAIMAKASSSLPDACGKCFDELCVS